MKRFVFTLERALDLRAHREREAEIALGRAVAAQMEIENRLKTLAHEQVDARGKRFMPENTVDDMRAWDRYLTRLLQQEEELLAEAARAEMETAAARAAYIEASRERKVLDKLKEKQLKAYRKEYLAEEVKMLDDVSSGSRTREQA